MPLLQGEIDDLRFYFSGAAQAAMGARSVMGAQLEFAQRSWLPDSQLGDCGMRKAPGDKRVVLSDDAIQATQIEAAQRARAIGGRLSRLNRAHQLVLELQYQGGDTRHKDAIGVSLALCAATQAALVAYHRFVERAAKRAPARPRGRMDGVLERKRIPVKQQADTLEQSVTEWIQWLAARRDKTIAAGSVLEAIVEEASAELVAASTAYARTREGAGVRRVYTRAVHSGHG